MVQKEIARPSEVDASAAARTNSALAASLQIDGKGIDKLRPGVALGTIPSNEHLLAQLGSGATHPPDQVGKPDLAPCQQDGTMRVVKSYVGTQDLNVPAASAVKISPDGGTAPSTDGKSYYGTAYHVGRDPPLDNHYSLMRAPDFGEGAGATRKGLDAYRKSLDGKKDLDSEDEAENDRRKSDADYVRQHFDEIAGKDGRITRDKLGAYYRSHYQMSIEQPDGTLVPAKRVQGSKADDAAILQTEATPGDSMPISDSVQKGDKVKAVGYPMGQACAVRPGTVTGIDDKISSDAYTQPGMSGGSLIDLDQVKDGKHPVVGFTDQGVRDPKTPHSEYAPSKVIMDLFEKQRKGETSD